MGCWEIILVLCLLVFGYYSKFILIEHLNLSLALKHYRCVVFFCAHFFRSKYFNVSVISCDCYNNHPSRAVTWAQGSEAELRLELRSFTYGSADWRFLWLRWPQSYLYLLASTVFWGEAWPPWARGSVGVWSQQFAACPFFSSRFSWSFPSSATLFLPMIDSGSPGMTSLFSPELPPSVVATVDFVATSCTLKTGFLLECPPFCRSLWGVLLPLFFPF